MIRKNLSVDEILNEFNNKSRLSDLISKYVQLTPRGNSFIGKCPFHNEKTPSFNVSDEKGLFHCFGCKVGGNAITFLMKYKNLSFKEAINELSIFAGLNINFQSSSDLKKKNDKITVGSIKTSRKFIHIDDIVMGITKSINLKKFNN